MAKIVFKSLENVYDIFKDFFGEDWVDLQGVTFTGEHVSWINNPFILVHFPEVRITNEFDKYVDIKDLWAKVPVTSEGLGTGHFYLNRSNYPISHITNSFMHSHIRAIPTYDFTEFQRPCLGTGPIRDTLCSLTRDYDENLWKLFCVELAKYVSVESVSGVPYHRLENIRVSNDQYAYNISTFPPSIPSITPLNLIEFKEFISYFVSINHLRFSYIEGAYHLAMPVLEYIKIISNDFIEWCNIKIHNKEVSFNYNSLISPNDVNAEPILRKCKIIDNNIYIDKNFEDVNDCKNRYEGKEVCTFKGETIRVVIEDSYISDENVVLLLNPTVSLYILKQVLKIVNFRYGRTEERGSNANTGAEFNIY